MSIVKTIQETLSSIVEAFESGSIPEAISYSMFPATGIPSAEWSFLNRIIMHLSGTADGRGFRQWKRVNRFVKKGSRAFYILVPMFKKVENDDGEEILAGFMPRPVFRVEDTDGEPLDYPEIKLPELSLIEKAHEWGISVKAVSGSNRFYGYFSTISKEIGLASKEETVFFHELSHAAHARMTKDFKKIQTWRKELVAELSATALCRLAGKTSRYMGSNYRYIKHFAQKANLTPVTACLTVMGDVENVLKLILAEGKKTPLQQPSLIRS